MIDTAIVVLLGVIGGLSVGIQGAVSNQISQRVGGTSSSFIIHVSGAFLSGLLLLLRGGEQIANWRSLSWYMLGAGAFGVILYLTLAQTFPRLGGTAALMLIIVGQLLMGIAIDQFGLFGVAVRPVDLTRVVAVLLLLVAGYLILR